MKFKDKKEVHDYLKNSKVRVTYKTIDVIKVLNKYGLCGNILNNDVAIQNILQAKFLFIQDESIYFSTNTYGFYYSNYKELSVDDILSIEIEGEEEVVKPHIFKYSEEVLMCDPEGRWRLELFRDSFFYRETEDMPAHTIYTSVWGIASNHCIPFEGNEELIDQPYNHEDGR